MYILLNGLSFPLFHDIAPLLYYRLPYHGRGLTIGKDRYITICTFQTIHVMGLGVTMVTVNH